MEESLAGMQGRTLGEVEVFVGNIDKKMLVLG
jgi:hypothetical protein